MRMWLVLPAMLALALAGAAEAHAQAPPTRAFGTVTIDGRPAPLGTLVQAVINDKLCGEGNVRFVNDQLPQGYVVDVLSFASSAGCGTDADTIRFRVGGVEAKEIGQFQSGTFLRLDLTVSGQVTTPAPGPTPPPFGAGQATPSPAPSVAPTVAPTGGASPSGTATASPAASPSGTGTAGASATVSPIPRFTATAAAPSQNQNDDGGGSGAVIAAAVIGIAALVAAGGYWAYRRRGTKRL